MSATVELEIVTPSELFYDGEIESLVCTTTDGEEGFLPGRLWCCKVLGEKGKVRLREKDGSVRTAAIKGGYVEIRDKFVLFTEDASWTEPK